MCGLAGFLGSDACASGPASTLLAGMAARLQHRGPDGYGQWSDPAAGIGLCHQRLAIQDLSPAGAQPMASPCGRWQLVFNGEIYNHCQLREQLEQLGLAPRWRGHSDSETLLAALAAWGVAATLPRLVGMFALALWDRQERRLALARDRFGEKPLFYALARSQTGYPLLLFGSELHALMVHPGYDRTLDRRSTALYLRHGYVPAPWCIHEQTRKLSPGCWLSLGTEDLSQTIDGIQQRQQAYWSALATAEHGLLNPFPGTNEEAVDAVERALTDAVARQSRADVPIGAFLSGGIDSSLVVALLQAQQSHSIKTFSIGFDDHSFNEAPYAAAVARHLGTDHTEMIVSGADALAVIPRLPAIYGEPFADSSQIPTALVAQLARQQVTVALSGDAGDELFGGYNRYVFASALWRKVQWLPHRLRNSLAEGLQRLPVLAVGRHRYLSDKWSKVADVLACGSAQELYVRLVSQWPSTSGLVVDGQEYRPAVLDPALWLPSAGLAHQMMLLDTLTYLPDDLLVKVDRAAMAVGLETRVPMLDPELFALAWSLPLDQKIASGRGKLLLRAVLARHLPEFLIDRPKMGFAVPLASWLRGPLRDWGEALLNPRRLSEQGLLHVNPVQQCWNRHQQDGIAGHYQLWPLLMLQAWMDDVAQLPRLQGVV